MERAARVCLGCCCQLKTHKKAAKALIVVAPNLLVWLTQKNSCERHFAPPAAPDFSRDNVRAPRASALLNFTQIGFGRVDVSLVTNSVTSPLLLCRGALILEVSAREDDGALLAGGCQSYCTFQQPRLVCGPSPALSKPPASSGFIYTSARLPNLQAAGLKCERGLRIGCWLRSHRRACQ